LNQAHEILLFDLFLVNGLSHLIEMQPARK